MTFNLTPDQVPNFIPLTGNALLKTIPPSYETDSGLVAIPKGIAHDQQEKAVTRKGIIVSINRIGDFLPSGEFVGHRCDLNTCEKCVLDDESTSLEEGQTVHYWGHMDEADNPYVVVKIGQIVAVEV